MKLYRCLIGGLLAFFIAIGVLFLISYYEKEQSMKDGTLIYYEGEDVCFERGAEKYATGYSICESIGKLHRI